MSLEPERYSREDVDSILKRAAIPRGPDGWKLLDAKWNEHEKLEIGPPTTPHEFALRFIHDWTRAPIGRAEFATEDAEMVYLALREAFFEAMSHEVKVHCGSQYRSFK